VVTPADKVFGSDSLTRVVETIVVLASVDVLAGSRREELAPRVLYAHPAAMALQGRVSFVHGNGREQAVSAPGVPFDLRS
jgi:hypothetical protein